MPATISTEGSLLRARHRRLLLAGCGAMPLLMAAPAAVGAGRPAAASAGFHARSLDEAACRLGVALTDTRGRLRRSTDSGGQVLAVCRWSEGCLVFLLEGMGARRAGAVCTDLQKSIGPELTEVFEGAADGALRAQALDLAGHDHFDEALAALEQAAAG